LPDDKNKAFSLGILLFATGNAKATKPCCQRLLGVLILSAPNGNLSNKKAIRRVFERAFAARIFSNLTNQEIHV